MIACIDDPICSVCKTADYSMDRCAQCDQLACDSCSVECEECRNWICLECAHPVKKEKRGPRLERPARGERADFYLCGPEYAKAMEDMRGWHENQSV